jgi:hypothetical protein
MIVLYGIEWEESELGWGTRPDGFSFHRTMEDALKFVDAYWAQMPDEAPSDYSRPVGSPRLIEVSQSLHDFITKYGDSWLLPKTASAYKTYDAQHMFDLMEDK